MYDMGRRRGTRILHKGEVDKSRVERGLTLFFSSPSCRPQGLPGTCGLSNGTSTGDYLVWDAAVGGWTVGNTSVELGSGANAISTYGVAVRTNGVAAGQYGVAVGYEGEWCG